MRLVTGRGGEVRREVTHGRKELEEDHKQVASKYDQEIRSGALNDIVEKAGNTRETLSFS